MRKSLFSVTSKRMTVLFLAILVFIGIPNSPLIQRADAEAAANDSLPADPTQSAQAEALGLSTEQPARIAPSGREIDKNNNPLGPDNLIINRTYQLGLAMGGSSSTMCVLNTLGASSLNTSTPVMASPQFSSSWNGAERAMAAADVDGDGTQEVVTAGLLSTGSGSSELHVFLADYNNETYSHAIMGKSFTWPGSRDYTAVSSVSYAPSASVSDPILHAAAGDFDRDGRDEVAVSLGINLYIFKVGLDDIQTVSSYTFGPYTAIARINTSYTPKIEMEALDTNGDGYQELVVAMGYVDALYGMSSRLLIYNGTNLSSPAANINLKPMVTDGENTFTDSFLSPSVDIGDVFGDGDKEIVVSGKLNTSGAVCLTYVRFLPNTETYESEQVINSRGYILFESLPEVRSANIGLKCVSLTAPVPGDPEYIVTGGFIFKYNQLSNAFEKKQVNQATNNSGKAGNTAGTSGGSITNINVGRDYDYILGTLAGNFDGNTAGREQIIMLHYNHWYGSNYVYATICSMDANGNITADLTQQWNNTTPYAHPAVCAPDVLNTGTRLEFEPEKSKFVFSNPTVIAVLGATPYYKELMDKYTAIYNVETTYGTESENSQSSSNGVTLSVGVSFGFDQELSVIVKIGEVEFETEIKNSFSYSYATSHSISKRIAFTNYFSDDAVVVMVIPSDIYYYKVYAPDGSSCEMAMAVPYSPVTTILPVTDYNRAAAGIDDAPIITPDVLKHTVGDPRSYPQSSAGLTNVSGTEVLLGGTSKNEDENFVAAGVGSSSVEQSITTSSSESKSFDYEFSVEVSLKINLFGATAGVSAGAGYKFNTTVSSTQSTERSGSVASVPLGYDMYNFRWCLAAYNYNLTAGDSTQECTVISYLVRPIGSFPPAMPSGLKTDSRKMDSVTLKWDPAQGAAGYKLYRSTLPSGTFSQIANLTGNSVTSFADSNIEPKQQYYYRVTAYAAKESVPSSTLALNALSLSSISVYKQPRLIYDSGNALDLSELMLTLRLMDGVNIVQQIIDYSELTGDFTVNYANGATLGVSDCGKPITVTYVPEDKSAETNGLTVYAPSNYDIGLDVVFDVGSARNSRILVPGRSLVANAALTNNSDTTQMVMLILALYDEKGAMVSMVHRYLGLSAKVTKTTACSVFLPSVPLNGYVAKVMVWDGTDFLTTTPAPKSVVIQIPQ